MKIRNCPCVLLLSLAAPALLATEYADLNRQEPVPAGQQIPIIDFVRPGLFEQVKLNYPGTQIGALVPGSDDHTNLVTYDLNTLKLDGISAPAGDRDIAAYEWLDGNLLTYIVSAHKSNSGYLFRAEGGKLSYAKLEGSDAETQSLERPAGIGGMEGSVGIIGTEPENRSNVLVFVTNPTVRYDIPALVDAANNGQLVTRYPELKTDHGFNLGWFPDKLGRLAYGITQEDGALALSELQNGTWVKCPENLEEIDFEGAGDNPGEIVVLGPRDGQAPRPLETMDAISGKVNEVILQDKGYDFDGWLFHDPVSHNIVGAIYDRAAPHVVWFTEAYRNLQKAVDNLFPGQVVRIQGMSDSGKILLISSGSDRQPVVYSWVDLEKHKSGLIKNSQPWIDPKRMQPMGIIKYTTAEGKQLDAYITLPAGATKANPPPVVVMPPEGSDSRWVWGYNGQVQFLASRGYAVLQPNHRGSSGYTWMFPQHDRWEFGKMADDVVRATKKAIAMGLVDGKRAGIAGVGFGGYLGVQCAASEPGLYKCVITTSAFYDWGKYIRSNSDTKYSSSFYSRYLYELGDPHKNSEQYDAISPLAHPDKIRSAVLVAWGEFDEGETRSQSSDLASRVKSNGLPAETLSFTDEGFGVHHLGHKIELTEHIEAFLKQNL
jgi:dienelactone hydrolase